MAQDFDIVVIGGGIAGLTAGREAAKAGRSTLVLTGMTLGGHLISIENVENWPPQPEGIPGYDLCPIAQEEAAEAGCQFEMVEADALSQDASGRWQVSAGGAIYSVGAVILATGTNLRKLGVPGEAEFEGRGVSQCASCDAPLLRGKDVVMVGGGDSALQETLALLGPAAKVTIVTDSDGLKAQPHFVGQVEGHPKVALRTRARITEIVGSDGVTAVRLDDGSEIACASVFVFPGLTPDAALTEAAKDETGAVIVDAQMRSSLRGLFAAGTVRSGAAFRAAASAEDGTIAAAAAHAYLLDGTWPDAAN